ncbi:inositol monophosphatase family protein, partial [Neisseria sp. P0020.S005]
LKPWDIAAGALIVQEAGGIVTDMSGNEGWLESGDIVAANPKVLAQMLQIISGHL